MSSLVRSRPVSPAQLLVHILERPELVAAVRELPASALARLIDRVGLEDAGELVALATNEQLRGVFDEDLWRAPAPGEDERFRPDRFALWLEIMSEGGESFLVEQMCALPRELLALAVHRLMLVVDTDALWQGVSGPSEELQRLERALDAPLYEEWEEFRLLARDPMHWDAVWGALVLLDRDHHALLREILEHCCALSSEYLEEEGGLYEVLTSEQMLEGDVAAEREDRRAAQGFVAPADARAFLELARRGGQLESRDPLTRAHFRSLASGAPARPGEGIARRRGARQGAPEADVAGLARLLESVAVIEPTPQQPLAALAAWSTSGGALDARSDPPQPTTPAQTAELLLKSALAELRLERPETFSERLAELGYLANVLIAGSPGRRPRAVEALETAISVCGTGLVQLLGGALEVSRAVELLEETPADQLFRRGYRG